MLAIPRYLTTRPSKNDSQRLFWQPPSHLRKAGFKLTRLSGDENAARMQAEQLNARLDAWRAGSEPVLKIKQVLTIAQLVSSYKNSFRFQEKSKATQKTYDYSLRLIKKELGEKIIRSLTASELQNFYRSLRRTPTKAVMVARVMRILLEHARRSDIIPMNPASRPGLSVSAKKAMLWQPEQVQEFVKSADALGYFTIGTAVLLNEWLGQRKGDIISLRADSYKDGAISKRQSKTGAEVILPVDIAPSLKARLEQQVNHNQTINGFSKLLLPSETGGAMSEASFASAFATIRAHAKLPDSLLFRALRHTAVTRLAEAGCTLPQIAAITGHSLKTCADIIERYTIFTRKMAEDAFRLRFAAEAKGAL